MKPIDFLKHRVAFSGLPFGELENTLGRVGEGEAWEAAFAAAALDLRRLAEARQMAGGLGSAAQAWLWTAAACQAASLGMHLDPDRDGWPGRVTRLRRSARSAYRRALALDPDLGRPVALDLGAARVRGYLREPRGVVRATLVLFNGLDSICEVELHRFGEVFVRGGFAVLTLAIPDTLGGGGEGVGFRVELAAPAIADWVEGRTALRRAPLGSFGVSFGGHLALRLLSGDPRFRAAAAVSPAAWLDTSQLALQRVRRMFALAFGVDEGAALDARAAEIQIDALPAPAGRLLVLHMERDELFGPEHCSAIAEWGGDRVEVRRDAAEHVGTSRIHRWLPEICDWFAAEL
jgi:hypothetical protein